MDDVWFNLSRATGIVATILAVAALLHSSPTPTPTPTPKTSA